MRLNLGREDNALLEAMKIAPEAGPNDGRMAQLSQRILDEARLQEAIIPSDPQRCIQHYIGEGHHAADFTQFVDFETGELLQAWGVDIGHYRDLDLTYLRERERRFDLVGQISELTVRLRFYQRAFMGALIVAIVSVPAAWYAPFLRLCDLIDGFRR